MRPHRRPPAWKKGGKDFPNDWDLYADGGDGGFLAFVRLLDGHYLARNYRVPRGELPTAMRFDTLEEAKAWLVAVITLEDT